jgi:chemotaxis protein MotA
MSKRHETMIGLFGNVGGTAGAMGMIGTLVGLVAMLANLSDPAAVGPAMAVALLTTMYGALIGTLFAGIIESKLAQKHKKEVDTCEVIIKGATMIAAEESIGNIKMQLNSILVDIEE